MKKLISPPPQGNRFVQSSFRLLLSCFAMIFSQFSQGAPVESLNFPVYSGDCATADVTISMPSTNFDICDFTFTVGVDISHDYTTSHSYRIEFTTSDFYFSWVNDGTLQNVSSTTTGPGQTTVSGLVTSVVTNPNQTTLSSHTLTFNRNASWPGIIKNFTIKVFDDDCDPAMQAEESFNLFTSQFIDLRPISETKLSELFAAGWIVLQPNNPSLPDLLIDNELEIDVPASLIGDVNAFRDVTLMPGARIRIATDNPGPGLTPNLFMAEVNVHTCPGSEMAEGILVDPQSTTGIPLTKLQMQNSIVADCRFGVNAKPNSSFSLENNQFTNNYIGVNLDMSSAPSGLARARIDGFAGNTFSTEGQLKPRYQGMPEHIETRGYCGIRLVNYRDFNVFGNSLSGGNDFLRLANGIVGTNSIGNLANMTFNDMNSADAIAKYPIEGFGISLVSKGTHWFNINEFSTTMTFNNCKTGISAFNYALNVENTEMNNVDIGISVKQSKVRDIVIDGNVITARKYGIRSFLNEPVHNISAIRNNDITINTGLGNLNDFSMGIQLEEVGIGYTPAPGQLPNLPPNGDGWEVSGNDVIMKAGGNGLLYRNGFAGILQQNDITNETQANDYTGLLTEGTTFSSITANTIDQTLSTGVGASTAIYSSAGFSNTFQCNCVDNTNVGMQFLDMADVTHAVRGNNFNTHCTGLQLGAQGVGGAYVGDQNHAGNLWDLTAIGGSCLGGRNWGGPADIGLSEFRVNGTADPRLNPTVFPSSNWFLDEPGSTFSGCATCNFPPQIPPRVAEGDVPTQLDEAIVTGALVSDAFANEMTWKGKYRLYRKILRHPAIESYSSAYTNFKTANVNLSTGKLAYIAEEKAGIFALTASEDSTLESRRNTWRQSMETLRQIDSLLQAGITVSQSQYDARVQQCSTAQSQYEQYAQSLNQTRQQRIQTLLTLNAAVSTGLAPDANHKTVNGIVLNLLLCDTLASGNLATLESIAEQCPLEGGDAVYEARAVVSYFTGQSFNDLEKCADTERQLHPDGINKLPESTTVALYPNPTSGHVFWTGTGGQTVKVRVLNALGQLAAELTSATSSVNFEQLPEGLYQVQLLASNNTVLATHKLQIINH